MSAAPVPLRRDPTHGYIAGVCSGFAARLGIDPMLIRIGFVLTLAAGGVGIPLYIIGWALIPAEGPERPVVSRLLNRRDTWLVAAGMGCLTLAAVLVLRNWGLWFGDKIIWPAVIAAAGGALIWRQSQLAPEAKAQRSALPREAVNRAGAGAALVIGGALLFLSLNDSLATARDVVLPVAVVLVAVTIILAPWWIRLVRGLAAERAARIRSQERAEVAAHLHDSVLQTLALVQKRADDPREVAALARRQERELRAWLNNTRPAGTATLAGALEAAAAEVEGDHHVPIEVVTVGDGPLDERSAALVAAAREALVNASKFAGPEPISLYAEVEDGRVEVFIRDRGPGFDPETSPGDRRGVRDSIIGRMERHGGRATVHSNPGNGTEVELVLEP
uniref:PspC domain-containing protein n=1 Tax=Solirubrobacter ginsenosidimutans TaxID=490573 RepID=A0A9X3N056_9ACTN|nr:ATP-binding protein [Solirubrobacter ginsenosidimutans]MDA0162413.1 PspC domain-containing protein [Solirubrobacter ginsenosidimutans]